MDLNNILSKVDHTLLLQGTTKEDIIKVCDDAIKNNVSSVCIPPYYVKLAKEYVKDNINVCTVIGFPNGYSTKNVKLFEAKDALENGADELDMVINICMVKNNEYDLIEDEIRSIKEICGKKILKVIIETCLLTEEEKINLCKIVTKAGADFIKTSTGFSKAGATFDDIKLFTKYIGKNVKIKAAGGISSLEDAEKFIKLGAERLGTSKIIDLINNKKSEGY